MKRQTVWLSTMMVLSLMLIGYYTMNNGSPGGSPSTAVSNSNVVTPGSTSTGSGQSNQAAANSTGQPSATGADWFVNDQTQVNDELAKRQSLDLKIMDNSNSPSDQIQTAAQDLQQVNQLQGGIWNAESAVESQGYAQCAVVPNPAGTSATVYVLASSLTPLKAAEILDVVSQNTGISSDNIHVQAQS